MQQDRYAETHAKGNKKIEIRERKGYDKKTKSLKKDRRLIKVEVFIYH